MEKFPVVLGENGQLIYIGEVLVCHFIRQRSHTLSENPTIGTDISVCSSELLAVFVFEIMSLSYDISYYNDWIHNGNLIQLLKSIRSVFANVYVYMRRKSDKYFINGFIHTHFTMYTPSLWSLCLLSVHWLRSVLHRYHETIPFYLCSWSLQNGFSFSFVPSQVFVAPFSSLVNVLLQLLCFHFDENEDASTGHCFYEKLK